MAVRWTYRIDKAGVTNSAAVVGQSVYVADDSGTIHAIDLATGGKRWTCKFDDGFATAPLVDAGRVFVGDTAGRFHAVLAATGEQLWTYDSGDAISASANLAPGGRVVFANDGGKVVCLEPADGKESWVRKLERTNGAAAVWANLAWVASCDAKLRSIGLASGEEFIVVDIGSQTGAAPIVIDANVVIGTNGGKVLCISAHSGEVLWTYSQIEDEAIVYSTAAVADNILVVGARDNNVHAINLADGSRRWIFQTQGEVDSSPAISGRRVYVGSKDGKLYVLDLRSGRLLWQFTAGQAITAGPAIARGVVVFGDTGGSVYCLEPKRP